MRARPLQSPYGPRAVCGPRDCRARRHRRAQRRHQDLFDVGAEPRRIDRPIEHGRRGESVEAQAQRRRCASASGCTACGPAAACPAGCDRSGATDPSSHRIHRERRIAAHRAAAASRATGAAPPPRQAGVVRRRVPFFLTVNPNRPMARQSVLSAAVVGSASRNSASVASGCAVISATRRCSWRSVSARRETWFAGAARSPVSRRRCFNRSTHARLTCTWPRHSLASCPRPGAQDALAEVHRVRPPWHLHARSTMTASTIQEENALTSRASGSHFNR